MNKSAAKALLVNVFFLFQTVYDTVYGIWWYFTVDDGQIDLSEQNYLMIGTLEAYTKMIAYFGAEAILPV